VARKPRQQRRARKAQDTPADNGQTSPKPKPKASPAPAPSPAARDQAKRAQLKTQPVKSQGGAQRAERRRGRFIAESWGELKKVEWPGRNQVTQGTVVVIIACAVVGAYLYVLDVFFAELVERII
jgi:preprotein translocase subunit SecE